MAVKKKTTGKAATAKEKGKPTAAKKEKAPPVIETELGGAGSQVPPPMVPRPDAETLPRTSLDPGTDLVNPEAPPPAPVTDDAPPLYSEGCPECKERRLVTEQKIYDSRYCRCLVCGWRGPMRSR